MIDNSSVPPFDTPALERVVASLRVREGEILSDILDALTSSTEARTDLTSEIELLFDATNGKRVSAEMVLKGQSTKT